MNKRVVSQFGGAGIVVLVVIVVLLAIIAGVSGYAIGTHDQVLKSYQQAEEGKAMMASALTTCKTQMAAVWDIAESAGRKQEDIVVGFAKARTGFEDAIRAYNEAAKDSTKSPFDLQKLVSQQVGGALANVRVTMEAVPQDFKAGDNYTKAQNVISECMNSIRGAIDDWSQDIKAYNSYRGKVFPSLFLNIFWAGKFQDKLDFYTGGIEDATTARIDISDIRPGK
jgi:hypothetical protein